MKLNYRITAGSEFEVERAYGDKVRILVLDVKDGMVKESIFNVRMHRCMADLTTSLRVFKADLVSQNARQIA